MKSLALLSLKSMLFAIFLLPSFSFADRTSDRLKALATLEILLADAGLSNGLNFESTVQFPSTAADGQDRVDVTLRHGKLGEVRFLMKGPRGFWRANAATYRALVVFSGFGSGQDVIEYLAPAPGTVMSESWQSLEILLVNPKIVLVPGPHIGLRELRMISLTRNEIFAWW